MKCRRVATRFPPLAISGSLRPGVYKIGNGPAGHQNSYHDLGGDYFLNRDNPDHRRRRAIAQLERLGYQVTLEPRAA